MGNGDHPGKSLTDLMAWRRAGAQADRVAVCELDKKEKRQQRGKRKGMGRTQGSTEFRQKNSLASGWVLGAKEGV